MANTFKFGNGNWAVKEDLALAYNDENGNFKPLPFDFTRASSATRVNKDGLLETMDRGMPRIDFTDNTSGHLLLEPSRTNKYPYSNFYGTGALQDFNAGTSTSTVTNNYTISPDGTQNAIRFEATVGSTSSDRAGLRDLLSVSAVDSTISFYGKSNTGSNQVIGIQFTGGTQTTVTLTNEWQRFEYTGLSNTGNYCGIEIRGTYTDLSVDVLLYGFQFEAGSYATSYIPTSGSTVTRVADDIDNESTEVLSLPNSASFYWNVKGQTEGNDDNNTGYAIRFRTNPTSSTTSYFGLNSNATVWRIRLQDGSTSQFKGLGVSKFEDVKVVVIVNTSTYSIYANGAAIFTNESYNGTAPTIEKVFRVESLMNNDDKGVIRVVDLKAYNTELTATEAQALTS